VLATVGKEHLHLEGPVSRSTDNTASVWSRLTDPGAPGNARLNYA